MISVVRELKCLASRAISSTPTPDSDTTETKCAAISVVPAAHGQGCQVDERLLGTGTGSGAVR